MASGNFLFANYVKTRAYAEGVDEAFLARSTIARSGVLFNSGDLRSRINGSSGRIDMPVWEDDADYGFVLGSDNLSTHISTNSPEMDNEVNYAYQRNTAFGFPYLSGDRSPKDPRARIVSRVANHEAQQIQKVVLSQLQGIFAKNVLAVNAGGGAGNMIYDVTASAFNATTTAFTLKNFIAARRTLGQNMDAVGVIFCNTGVYSEILALQGTDVTSDNALAPNVGSFMGFRVELDTTIPSGTDTIRDSNDAGSTANANNENVYILLPGSFAYADNNPRPVGVEVTETGGNGAGGETLVTRHTEVIHPVGLSLSDTALAYTATSAGQAGLNTGTSTNQWGNAATWAFKKKREHIYITAMAVRNA